MTENKPRKPAPLNAQIERFYQAFIKAPENQTHAAFALIARIKE